MEEALEKLGAESELSRIKTFEKERDEYFEQLKNDEKLKDWWNRENS